MSKKQQIACRDRCVSDGRVRRTTTLNGFPHDVTLCRFCQCDMLKRVSYIRETARFMRHASSEAVRLARRMHERGIKC